MATCLLITCHLPWRHSATATGLLCDTWTQSRDPSDGMQGSPVVRSLGALAESRSPWNRGQVSSWSNDILV